MIKATFIFGQDAVRHFADTDKVPSKKWLKQNDGNVLEREFATQAEMNAYLLALEDYNGWWDYAHTELEETT